jgi:hypothetical protein
VNWCYLGSVGAFGGILLMWDRRVMEKSEEFGGGGPILWRVLLEMLMTTLSGRSSVFMILMPTVTGVL